MPKYTPAPGYTDDWRNALKTPIHTDHLPGIWRRALEILIHNAAFKLGDAPQMAYAARDAVVQILAEHVPFKSGVGYGHDLPPAQRAIRQEYDDGEISIDDLRDALRSAARYGAEIKWDGDTQIAGDWDAYDRARYDAHYYGRKIADLMARFYSVD